MRRALPLAMQAPTSLHASSFSPALLATIAALAVGVLGCVVERGAPDEDVATAEDAICAAGKTLKGVDVSSYQGKVDWKAQIGSTVRPAPPVGTIIAIVGWNPENRSRVADRVLRQPR